MIIDASYMYMVHETKNEHVTYLKEDCTCRW